MPRPALPLAVILLTASLVLGQAPKSAPVSILDKIEPSQVPAAYKPTGNSEKALAIIGDREAKLDCACFSPNGKYLAYGGPGETITVLEFPDFKTVATIKNKETVAMTFSPTSRTFAASDSKGVVRVWRISSGNFTLHQTIEAHKGGPAWGLTFVPGGQQIVTSGKDGIVKVWDLRQTPPKAIHTLTGHKDTVRAVAANWDGTLVASAGLKDGTLRLWDISGEKAKEAQVETFKDVVTWVSFDPDGKKLAVAVMDGKVRIYNTTGGKLKLETAIPVKKDRISQVCFSSTGDFLAVLGLDPIGDRLMVYGVDGRQKFDMSTDTHIESIAYAPDGRHLALVYERNVHLLRTGTPPKAK